MKFTRDSMLYTVSFVASVLTFLATDFNMLHMAFPSLTSAGEAKIKFAAALVGFVAGYLKMSPLPLSFDHPLATHDSSTALSPFNSTKPIAGLVLACALAGATLSGCALHQQPPVGTYSPTGTKAYNADQLVKDLTALSATAINLNAQTGKLHLSDRDTALVRDFALSAGAALHSYGTGGSTLQQVRDAYGALMRNLSVDGSTHPQLAAALMAIGVALNQVQ